MNRLKQEKSLLWQYIAVRRAAVLSRLSSGVVLIIFSVDNRCGEK
jgi:hypothetical protein